AAHYRVRPGPRRHVGGLAPARAPNSVNSGALHMEVILRHAVENLGKPGDVVKVKNGYARNYVLPHGLAYEATPGNLKRIQQERDRLDAAENERRTAAQTFAERLEQVSLTFSARVGEEGKLFGSVTTADIAQQLEAQGFHIEK